MIESVDILERIANPKKPPMNQTTIEKIKINYMTTMGDTGKMARQLKGMTEAFEDRGDMSSWNADLLTSIDDCFVKIYMVKSEPHPCLFFPHSTDNLNKYVAYCGEVDRVLRETKRPAPQYAREYFAYYSIFWLQKYTFPVPLGTKSVINALHKIATSVKDGFTEVSGSRTLDARQGRTLELTKNAPPRGHLLDGDARALVARALVEDVRGQRPVQLDGADGVEEGRSHFGEQQGHAEDGESSRSPRGGSP